MRPEPPMVGNAENSAIALRFDDGKELPYLLYFQVLKGLFSSLFRFSLELNTLSTLNNSTRKGPFFAHVFALYKLFVPEFCITNKLNGISEFMCASQSLSPDRSPRSSARVFRDRSRREDRR